MTTRRFVFDTNVLVSAALRRHSLPRQALDYALLYGILLVSDVTVHELREVLFRPKFDNYISEQTRLLFLATVLNKAETVEIIEQIMACRDPKYDMFLSVGVNGVATCIVSGDDDLLALHPFRTIPIVTPKVFLSSTW